MPIMLWTIQNFKQQEDDKMGLREESAIDLVETLSYYIKDHAHSFKSKKELLEHLTKLCELQVKQN